MQNYNCTILKRWVFCPVSPKSYVLSLGVIYSTGTEIPHSTIPYLDLVIFFLVQVGTINEHATNG